MKQVFQDRRTGRIEVRDVPAPALAPGCLLVRNVASVISSGTERSAIELGKQTLLGKARERPDLVRKVIDTARKRGVRDAMRAVASKLDEPTLLGYSSAGIVLEISHDVTDFQPGDRVACAGFGRATHAEFVSIPKNLAVRVPTDVMLEHAAFVSLGAIALHGVRLTEVGIGDVVAVIGLGLVGLIVVQILRAGGCRVIGIDISAERCTSAVELGAEEAFPRDPNTVDKILKITSGRGVDATIIAAATKSNDPVQLAGEISRDRARVCVVGDVGMDLPRPTYYGKELDLRISRSYGPGRYDPVYEEQGIEYPIGYVPWPERRNMEEFIRLVSTGGVRLDPLTGKKYPIECAVEAYETLAKEGAHRPVALVFTYSEKSEPTRLLRSPIKRQKTTGGPTVSFVGAGSFARSILIPRFARHGALLRGVVTMTGPSASTVADRFGFEFHGTDVSTILRDSATDVIVIATRHDTHSSLAIEALKAGKHVFVEKPLALNRSELDELLQVAQEAPCQLMVGFNRRFAPLAARLKQEFNGRSRPFAITYRVNAGALPPEHWTRDKSVGGGRIIGEACHFVDFMQFLTDADPIEVSAYGIPTSDGGSVDTVSFTVKFSEGSIGTVHYCACGNAALPKERVEVFAAGRAVVLDDFRRLEIYRGGRRKTVRTRRQDKGHDEEVRRFIETCRIGGPPLISLRSLALSSVLTFAVEEALTKGSPVQVGLQVQEMPAVTASF